MERDKIYLRILSIRSVFIVEFQERRDFNVEFDEILKEKYRYDETKYFLLLYIRIYERFCLSF